MEECVSFTLQPLYSHIKNSEPNVSKNDLRISAGVHITVKRNISDPDRNQNPACNFTDGTILLLHIKLTSSKSNITILKIINQTSEKP
jgi:hypothetical protein